LSGLPVRPISGALRLVLVALLAGSCSSPQGPPNIILISVDTLRWDYLGTYGYGEPGISPNIDWLAEQGTVFEQAVSSAGTTVPSHGTMLTGLYPRMHGARSNHHGIYEDTDTIARALTDAGYRTGSFTSTYFMNKVGRLDRGFEANPVPFDDDAGRPGPQAGGKTVADAMSWLGDIHPAQSWFLFMHLWEPHGPYDPSEWARERMGDYEGFLADGVSIKELTGRTGEIRNDPDNLMALRALYAGEVHRVDGIIGTFLEQLKEHGLLDNTVVIFTADHGQGLGEDGHMGHGANHKEIVIRVPLIIADFRDGNHKRVDTRVGTIDIAPTISDLAGLAEPFDWFGYSLLDIDSLDPEKPYFAEVELRSIRDSEKRQKSNWYDPNALGVWAGNFKLVSRHDASTLLHTYTDNTLPTAMDIGDEPILFNYMSGLIESFRETPLDFAEGEVTEEMLEQLRGLGYVQ